MIKYFLIDRKYRLPRIWSNSILRTIAPLFHGDIVNISAWEDKDKEGCFYKDYFCNADSYTITNFGGERGRTGVDGEIYLDLTSELDKKYINRFDVCFNHTTLEHIYDVKKAFSTISLMTKDIFIVVVPFSQTQHESEKIGDFWRFTPSCLREMFHENGMSVIYEAINGHNNSGIYLIFVGTKNHYKWENKLPQYSMLNSVGESIGESMFGLIKRAFRSKHDGNNKYHYHNIDIKKKGTYSYGKK